MSTFTCVYPQCTLPARTENPKPRRDFCAEHANTMCFFANTKPQMCFALSIPHSTFCREHDAEMVRFDFMHNLFHQKMAANAIAQQEAKPFMGNIKHNGLYLR